jgi:apolipoprotein N-acyltransferase
VYQLTIKINAMKTIANAGALLIAIFLFCSYAATAQTTPQKNNSQPQKSTEMKTYLIERDIPDAGKLTPDQLKAISQKSNSVLKSMGPDIQWVESYVTGDKFFCVYKAKNEELIKEHAVKGGFPANVITEVPSIISPATAGN